jgi:hypothetical protein
MSLMPMFSLSTKEANREGQILKNWKMDEKQIMGIKKINTKGLLLSWKLGRRA